MFSKHCKSDLFRFVHVLPMTFAMVTIACAFSGCGGTDMGNSARSSNSFDQGLSGNYSGFGGQGGRNGTPTSVGTGRGVYSRIEARFELDGIKGNTYDFVENDIQVYFSTPDNRVNHYPAFYTGSNGWCVRFSPENSGKYVMTRVTRNGQEIQPQKSQKREFEVSGQPVGSFRYISRCRIKVHQKN